MTTRFGHATRDAKWAQLGPSDGQRIARLGSGEKGRGRKGLEWRCRKHGAGAGSGTFFGESILPTLSVLTENMYLTLLRFEQATGTFFGHSILPLLSVLAENRRYPLA